MKLIFALMAIYSTSLVAQTVTIAADEWYPMNGDIKAGESGFMIDLADQALALKGMNIEYRVMPWERAILQARGGLIDCVVGASVDDVPDFIFGQEEYGLYDTTFYVRHGDPWHYQSKQSLDDKKVGAILGYAYAPEVDGWLELNAKKMSGNKALDKNIKMLLSYRLDTVIESSAVMRAKLKQMGLSTEVMPAGNVGHPTKIYVACGPNSDRSQLIVDALDEGIRILRAQGDVQQIMQNYGLTDWK